MSKEQDVETTVLALAGYKFRVPVAYEKEIVIAVDRDNEKSSQMRITTNGDAPAILREIARQLETADSTVSRAAAEIQAQRVAAIARRAAEEALVQSGYYHFGLNPKAEDQDLPFC